MSAKIATQELPLAGSAVSNPALNGPAKGESGREQFEDPVYVAPSPQKIGKTAGNAFRILFVGNSITRHGIAIDKLYKGAPLKWDHVAGMAASCEDKDFAHLLAASLQAAMPGRKLELYFHDVNWLLAGGKLAGADDKPYPHPHVVVVQTGEHEGPGKSKDEVAKAYEQFLIRPFQNMKPRPVILCAGIWFPSDGEPYGGWVRNVDDAYKAVCSNYTIPYVSVERLASDPSCRGWGEHPGVKWHPNDKGMEGYAAMLFDAYCHKDSGVARAAVSPENHPTT